MLKIIRKKENKGITLIALVVTIIVLLILAGVSISMLTGENGILKRANEAKEETVRATEEEQRKMAMYEASTNISGMTFQGVEIPEGFAPTRMPGESTVEEGLVITDSKGNEFVWIPCEYDSETAEANGKKSEDTIYYNDSADESSKHDNRNSTWRKEQWYYNGGTWYDGQPHSEGIKNSIKTHHGFYVARYEAGVPKEASFYVDPEGRGKLNYSTAEDIRNDNDKIKNGKIIPVSQKGRQAWNCISQENAKIAASKMVESNQNVQSYLIDSHAWNTICRLIEKRYSETNDVKNSTTWGNYHNNTTTKYERLKGLWAIHTKESSWIVAQEYNIGIIPSETAPKGAGNNALELATGMSEDFKVYNVYDLAGNMYEWTTERGKSNGNSGTDDTTCNETDCANPLEAPNAVRRGGDFNADGSVHNVVFSYAIDEIDKCDFKIGFRAVLYLK